MMSIGDLVRYDPTMFREPTLSEKQSRPFGWLKDDYEGTEQGWVGLVLKVDENMWGNRWCHKQDGGLGYEIQWSHGLREKVYAFEIEEVKE